MSKKKTTITTSTTLIIIDQSQLWNLKFKSIFKRHRILGFYFFSPTDKLYMHLRETHNILHHPFFGGESAI